MIDNYIEKIECKILLIEDNADHAELLINCFEDYFPIDNIYHAPDGEIGLNYLLGLGDFADRAKYPLPTIVLLDLRLPKVDGLEALIKIKSVDELKNIPIIILTSSENPNDISKAYRLYANSYLVKPFDYEKLLKLVKAIYMYWLERNTTLRKINNE